MSYLFDVALDELGGGHLLRGQALLQLELVGGAGRLASFHPANTKGGGAMSFSLSVQPGCWRDKPHLDSSECTFTE